MTTPMISAGRTSSTITPSRVSMASQNSRGTSLRYRFISPTFIRWETAWMISAASTASGRSVNRGVNATTVTRLSTAAMTGDISVRAPAPSLTADWDRLPPQASPPSTQPAGRSTYPDRVTSPARPVRPPAGSGN